MMVKVTMSPVANTPVTLPVTAILPATASLDSTTLSAVTGSMLSAVLVAVLPVSST